MYSVYSRVWRTCVVIGVTVGLVRLWLDHPVATVVALPAGALFLFVLLRVWHWALTYDLDAAPAPPSFQSAVDAAVILLGVTGLLMLEVLLGITALVLGFLTSPRVIGPGWASWTENVP